MQATPFGVGHWNLGELAQPVIASNPNSHQGDLGNLGMSTS
jgi:hypothetical protein